MSFKIPTPQEIQKRLIAEAVLAQGTQNAALPGTAENMVVRTMTVASSEMYRYIAFLALQILPLDSATEFLARHATFWLGQAHKDASVALGAVDVVGTAGVTIPAGTIVSRADGYLYSFDDDATISGGGTVQASVTSETTGLITNTAAGIELSLSAPILGVETITVSVDGLGGGADVESDEYLYGRIAERVQNPPQAGASHDYERWAKEVSGVTRAWEKSKAYGLGTVGVTFVMDGKEDIIPTAPEVALVQAHIDNERPLTADVTVFAPVAQAVDFEIELSPNNLATQNAVKSELESFFKREATAKGVTLHRSRISEVVSIAVGENNHTLITPAASITFNYGTLPVLGEITWSAA